MSQESTPISELDVGDTTTVVTRVGPFTLHVDMKKRESGGFEIFGKGVEQARPTILGSDMLGPVSDRLYSMMYTQLAENSYEIGSVISEQRVSSMEVR